MGWTGKKMAEVGYAAGLQPEAPTPYTYKPENYSSHTLLLASLPPAGEGSRLLDVGGGEGYLSRILTARGYQVICIALPGTAASSFPGGVKLVEADLDFELPEVGDRFAFVVCGDILEHLRDPLAVLRWLRTLLAPGGRLVASLPNSGHAYVRWNVLRGRFPAHDRGLFDRTHLHYFPWRRWQELLAAGGFAIEKVEPTATPFALALPWLRAGWALRALELLSYTLGRLWKTLFAYQFVIVARPADAAGFVRDR
jgi:SAM-dependent methyltransferase